jgi:hypothetical protein
VRTFLEVSVFCLTANGVAISFKATAIVTLNLKSLRWPRPPLGPAVPLLTIGPGTATGTKTIYAAAQLAMQIDRVKQILSSLYLLGDYGSLGNPTRASEGSLGPRGVVFPLGPGPLIPAQPISHRDSQ